VKRQITIRWLLAILMIAGLVVAPLSRPVMAGMTSAAPMAAMADDMSMSATADAMSMSATADAMSMSATADAMSMSAPADEMANGMPCCPSKAPAPIDCDKCVFMAACMTKCFAGMSAAIVHPVSAASARIASLRNDSSPDSMGHPPPDQPPRILT
jgi:hypothetical protein